MRLRREWLSLIGTDHFPCFLCYAPAQSASLSFLAPTIFLIFILWTCAESDSLFFLFFGTDNFSCFCVMNLRRERLSLFGTNLFPCFFMICDCAESDCPDGSDEVAEVCGQREPCRSNQFRQAPSNHSTDLVRVLGFFSSRRNWDPSTLSTAGKRAPPLVPGRSTLACGRGGRGVLIATRGHTLWYTTYIYSTFWITITTAKIPTEKVSTEKCRNSVVFLHYSFVCTSSRLSGFFANFFFANFSTDTKLASNSPFKPNRGGVKQILLGSY